MSMKKPTTPYKNADEQLKKILRTAKREFNKHRLKNFLPFDEINVLRLKKTSKSLYKKLDKMNREFYMRTAQEAYRAAGGQNELDEEWLLVFLENSDPVTEYIYTHEVDRKRDRFFESILALLAVEHTSLEIEKTYKKAIDLWCRQTEQYEINIVDYARVQAFKENGEGFVQWFTQEDEKVCAICAPRNGEIYPINAIPDRHYNCRCWVEAI